MPIVHVHSTPTTPRGRKERGASLVEYALMVALIAVVCISAVTFLGGGTSDKMNEAGDGIANVATEAPAQDPNAGGGCGDARPGSYATGDGFGYDCFDPNTGLGFNL